jgi:hypothetical protein
MSAVNATIMRGRWGLADRVLVASLAVLLTLGTPGFGFETRHPSNETMLTAIAFVLFVLPLLTIGLSFVRPQLAAWLGVITGIVLGVLTLLDVLGIVMGSPSTAMYVIDGLLVVASAVTALRCWVISRAG